MTDARELAITPQQAIEVVRKWVAVVGVGINHYPEYEDNRHTLVSFIRQYATQSAAPKVHYEDCPYPTAACTCAAPQPAPEAVAEIVYDAMPYTGVGQKPAWKPGGNAMMQDVARDAARKIAALTPAIQEPIVDRRKGERRGETPREYWLLSDKPLRRKGDRRRPEPTGP